ncbi:MAG: tetratricopeptide repeat protein [Deltaproteobacteria bacterium]|jgi:hypothetical protein|nr:tetratricopeptide repeat protein [Deltaproteobacteria bacterium]
MPLQLPLFLALTALAALASPFLTCGTAQAAPEKPGKGDGGTPKGAGKANANGGAPGPSPRSAPVDDRPEWRLPYMGSLLELGLEEASRTPRKKDRSAMHRGDREDPLEAPHAWDGLRALAMLALGQEDPRVWAILTRCAVSLEDFLAGKEAAAWSRKGLDPGWHTVASLASGAVEGLKAASCSGTGFPKTSPDVADDGRPEAGPGGGELARALDAEMAFARGTLRRIQKRSPSVIGTKPTRTLAEFLYPARPLAAAWDSFPSADELRSRLEAAEGQGGPGPKSREALVSASLLGAEIFDTCGRDAHPEAVGLMKTALKGLEQVAGNRDQDSLAAKERLGRRLAGTPGYGSVLPAGLVKPSPEFKSLALKQYRSIRLLANGPEGRALVDRADLAVSGLLGNERTKYDRLFYIAISTLSLSPWPHQDEMPAPWTARAGFDSAELLLRSDQSEDFCLDLHMCALQKRRTLLGAVHPETASSLARVGDYLCSASAVQACGYWALALEALEGSGERAGPFRADLEMRIGRVLLYCGDSELALPLLRRSEEVLRNFQGERSQQALTCAALLARAQLRSGMAAEAGDTYGRIATILGGAPARRDPDPFMPSDETLLATALAGTADAAACLCGRAGAESPESKIILATSDRKAKDSLRLSDWDAVHPVKLRTEFSPSDAVSLHHGYAMAFQSDMGDRFGRSCYALYRDETPDVAPRADSDDA